MTIDGSDLQGWIETMSEKWRLFLLGHPEVLALPCDIRETHTVAEFLQHIVAVELRYAERLHDRDETPYQALPFGSVEQIYEVHGRAMSLLTELRARPDGFWDETIEFATRSAGTLQRTRRTVFVHLLMHSVRHYAQLATLVRQHGSPIDFGMDYLLSQP